MTLKLAGLTTLILLVGGTRGVWVLRVGIIAHQIAGVSAADAGFQVDTNRVVILDAAGGQQHVPLMDKHAVAHVILDRVVQELANNAG